MAFPPSVLLLDDGELSDVRRLLDGLGVDFVHLRGASIGEKLEPPRDLLLTTTRRAQTIPCKAVGDGAGPVRVVVASEEAETLRERLRRDGVDFMVRRPVHSEALRLLVLRALYRGPEKRRALRVPFGVPVLCRIGSSRSEAVLVELSTGGCRLLVPEALLPGTAVEVTIPPEVDGEERLPLRGTVLRCHAAQGAASLAVAFERMDADREAALARTLLRRAVAPVPESDERRGHVRRLFQEAVKALDQEASRALVGRDLSRGGMRVDPHPELAVGDELSLEIYGFADSEPARVRAVVIRDDGPEGLALRFQEVGSEVARRLEELVTALPSIEPLAGGETGALGAVLGRIVPER
jgi:hypothetical protein